VWERMVCGGAAVRVRLLGAARGGASRAMSSVARGEDVSALYDGADEEQRRLMQEQVILVDRDDQILGGLSKQDSHLISNDLPLHRAFSVLLFDSQHRMLLQQRASTKLTFPSYWTNACCSHPLLSIPGEPDGVVGARRAAVRKLNHELGIAEASWSSPLDTNDELTYMTRVHYRSDEGSSCGRWGEHEIDYVFTCVKDVELNPSPNEVDAVKYVTQSELNDMMASAQRGDPDVKITPWFAHIVSSFANNWWASLGDPSALRAQADLVTIHRFGAARDDPAHHEKST